MFLHRVFGDYDEKYSGGSSLDQIYNAHISKLMKGTDFPSSLIAEHYHGTRDDGTFEKHQSRQKKGDGIDLKTIFRGHRPPKPCEAFLGRENELEVLAEAIEKRGSSIPGMGKSEVAKAYAQKYADQYREMIWISYTENLKHSIIELERWYPWEHGRGTIPFSG